MNNFLSRTITGTLLVAILIAGISINQFTFLVVFGLVTIGTLWEFYKIFKQNDIHPQRWPGIIIGILIFIGSYLISNGKADSKILLWSIPVFLYLIISELFRQKQNPFINIAVSIFGVVYITVPFSLFWFLAFWQNIYLYNPHLIIAFFISIWTYDTFAYLAGMAFGKHKLFERISPKKTWEGAIGGLIFCLIAVSVISHFYNDMTLWQWLFFAMLVSVFGTVGDLTESMLKRSFGIKDTSNILPGHGGLLDRFDAVLLAVPAVFIYLQLI